MDRRAFIAALPVIPAAVVAATAAKPKPWWERDDIRFGSFGKTWEESLEETFNAGQQAFPAVITGITA